MYSTIKDDAWQLPADSSGVTNAATRVSPPPRCHESRIRRSCGGPQHPAHPWGPAPTPSWASHPAPALARLARESCGGQWIPVGGETQSRASPPPSWGELHEMQMVQTGRSGIFSGQFFSLADIHRAPPLMAETTRGPAQSICPTAARGSAAYPCGQQ